MNEVVNLSDSGVLVEEGGYIDKRQFWRAAVDMQRSSGLNIRLFCRQEGLSEALFYAWRKKLSNLADEKAVIGITKTKKEPFVEIDLSKTSTCPLILEITGLGILKIQSGFDVQALKQFLKVMQELDKC